MAFFSRVFIAIVISLTALPTFLWAMEDYERPVAATNSSNSSNLSINLVFINPEPLPTNSAYLFGTGEEPEQQRDNFTARLIGPAIQWAIKNPEAKVNIWYDGHMVDNATVIENCCQLLGDEFNKEHGKFAEELKQPQAQGANISFRNIREIDLVNSFESVFAADRPVYWRADMARAMVQSWVIRRDRAKIAVYADLDIAPFAVAQKLVGPGKQIVDIDSEVFRMVKADPEKEQKGYENSFLMLFKAGVEAHDQALVRASARLILEDNFDSSFEDLIFDQYLMLVLRLAEPAAYAIMMKTEFFQNYGFMGLRYLMGPEQLRIGQIIESSLDNYIIDIGLDVLAALRAPFFNQKK